MNRVEDKAVLIIALKYKGNNIVFFFLKKRSVFGKNHKFFTQEPSKEVKNWEIWGEIGYLYILQLSAPWGNYKLTKGK